MQFPGEEELLSVLLFDLVGQREISDDADMSNTVIYKLPAN